MKLFENGESRFSVVCGKDLPRLAHAAAEEIQWAVKEIGGAELPIVEENDGSSIRLTDRGEGILGGQFDEDYRIDVTQDDVVIAGSGERGILYGAYAFLERWLGVRYLTADTTLTPRRDSIELRPGTVYEKPDIAIRRMPFKCATGKRIGGRLRFNQLSGDPALIDQPEYGRGDYPAILGHSIPAFVPDELFEAHPEYFPLIDGGRRHGPHHQRCLTNPDVLRLSIEAVKKYLRENPMQTTIAVGQADTYPDKPNNCTCPACRAIDEAEGTPMGSLMRFVNQVAEAIEGEFPQVMVNTLAYRYTRKPPKTIKPRDNVMVVLCSIECCFSHPIGEGCGAEYADGPIGTVSNKAFVEDIEGWAAISKNLMIWDYVTNFLHYLAPHPNLHCVGPNVRFFKEHNAYGIYPEGAHDCRGAEMDEARTYVLSKLLWDCETDEEVDLWEFMIGKIGPAAASVMRGVELLKEHVEKENIHMSTYHEPDERTFPKELVDRLDELYDRAEAVAPDEKAKEYVERLRMPLRYVKICLYTEGTDGQRREIGEKYLQDMDRLGVDTLMEGGNMARSRERIYRLLKLEG